MTVISYKVWVTMLSAVWWPLDRLQAQHSTVQLFIWNEMNSDAKIAAHLSIGPNVNGQQNLIGFVQFFHQYLWMIFVDMLVFSVVERWFRLGLNHLIPLRKVYLGEGAVQSTLFCIFNHCHFISSPSKLKICHTIKKLYVHNIMPKHENDVLQKK